MARDDRLQSRVSDRRFLRDTFGRFASGVTVMMVGDSREVTTVHGMTANSFISVSLEPPLVLVSLDHRARMYALLEHHDRFGLSVLAEDQKDISQHFAGRPIEGYSPGYTWQGEVPVLDGALAWMACRVHDRHVAGDHTLVIGEVRDCHYEQSRPPLLFFEGAYGGLAPCNTMPVRQQ